MGPSRPFQKFRGHKLQMGQKNEAVSSKGAIRESLGHILKLKLDIYELITKKIKVIGVFKGVS